MRISLWSIDFMKKSKLGLYHMKSLLFEQFEINERWFWKYFSSWNRIFIWNSFIINRYTSNTYLMTTFSISSRNFSSSKIKNYIFQQQRYPKTDSSSSPLILNLEITNPPSKKKPPEFSFVAFDRWFLDTSWWNYT